MKRYDFIEHTADIGIKIYGRDLKELFINAAHGMFEIITDLKKVKIDKSIKIQVEAPSQEELLVSWLGELLYYHNTKELLFKKFDLEELDSNHLKAKVLGEKLDKNKHELKAEIKAVTYHALKIEKADTGLTAQVIFDV